MTPSSTRAAASLVCLVAALSGCRHRSPEAVIPSQDVMPVVYQPAEETTSAPACRDLSVPALVERVGPAVTSIVAGRLSEDEDEPGPRTPSREHAFGSGFVISADGLVLTSYHLVERADTVRARLPDGRTFPATVVGQDKLLDVALLRLEGARGLRSVELGSSDAAKVGDPVVAVGNPFGLGQSVSRGIVSAKARTVDEDDEDDYLQTDAAINPGSSGGPLVDGAGRVIGINAAIVPHSSGIGFAVPIDEVRPILPELLVLGRVTHGHLGATLQDMDATLAHALRAPGGALVAEIEPGGAAAKAGLRAGDVVVSLGSRAIERSPDLAREVRRRKPGEIVEARVYRNGRPRTVAIRLGSGHDDATESAPEPRPAPPPGWVGLHAGDAPGGGAKVESIEPGSPAAEELERGDVVVEVNHEKVSDAQDLARRLARAPRPGTTLLRVKRGGSYRFVAIELR